MRRVMRSAALGVALLMLAGCGDSGDSDTGADDPTTTAAVVDDGAEETPSTDTETADEATADETDEAASTLPPVFDDIAVEPSDAGPRPTLAWAAVDGAAEYRVVVLDADGAYYWAWTGTDTSVVLGGVDDPDAIGAFVFEPLTWTVAALDADGAPLALSTPANLEP